jgi:hypothetical protein
VYAIVRTFLVAIHMLLVFYFLSVFIFLGFTLTSGVSDKCSAQSALLITSLSFENCVLISLPLL